MRVVVAEDQLLAREGIVSVLEDGGIDVVGEAGNAEELMALVAGTRPDVAVVDVRMPPTYLDEGLHAASAIAREFPATGVLILSQHIEVDLLPTLLGTTSNVGYLLKDRIIEREAFLEAIHRVRAGDPVIDPQVVRRLFAKPETPGPLARLSPREVDVLALMAEGYVNHTIADRLSISERTVEVHVRQIFAKLELDEPDTRNRRVLAVLAFLEGRPH